MIIYRCRRYSEILEDFGMTGVTSATVNCDGRSDALTVADGEVHLDGEWTSFLPEDCLAFEIRTNISTVHVEVELEE